MTMLPPETTPEWTADDEREMQEYAQLSPSKRDYIAQKVARFAREIIRLRSEREAQDAEIAKLRSDNDRLRGVVRQEPKRRPRRPQASPAEAPVVDLMAALKESLAPLERSPEKNNV